MRFAYCTLRLVAGGSEMRRVLLAMTTLLICTQVPRVAAQPPSNEQLKSESGFVRVKPFRPVPYDIAALLRFWIQAAAITYDKKNGRLTAQGGVKVYFQNYILTADKLIYDRDKNKRIAEGNAQLKDPNGSITRADRLEASEDDRDAFVKSLSHVLGSEFNKPRRAD
jgi:lipopolysaccharide assembly outer membrane protein LptD (OstA)